MENFGFSRDGDDMMRTLPSIPSLPPPLPPPPPSQHLDWIELRAPTNNQMLHTEYLPPAEYEIQSYPISNYAYTHQSPPPRANIINFHSYPEQYENQDESSNIVEDYDDELDNFRLHPYRRPEINLSHVQRTDTSTESFGGNYSTTMPKSILKGSTNPTPPPDARSKSYSSTEHDYPSPQYDQSPRVSVKINTDESILMDYPSSAIEKIIPIESMFSSKDSLSSSPSLSLSSSHRMRFASVSHLNDIEWEVPSEFQTVVYDLADERQRFPGAPVHNSNENLNRNNSNNNANSSPRQRSQSAVTDQNTYVSRLFVPWNSAGKTNPSLSPSEDNSTERQAFEYWFEFQLSFYSFIPSQTVTRHLQIHKAVVHVCMLTLVHSRRVIHNESIVIRRLKYWSHACRR